MGLLFLLFLMMSLCLFLLCVLLLSMLLKSLTRGFQMTNTIQKKFKVSSTQLLYQSCPYQAITLFIVGPFLDGLLTSQNVFAFKYTPNVLVRNEEYTNQLPDILSIFLASNNQSYALCDCSFSLFYLA